MIKICICIFLSKLQVPTEVCDGKRPYIHCDPYVDEVKEKVPREVCTPECKNIAKLVSQSLQLLKIWNTELHKKACPG